MRLIERGKKKQIALNNVKNKLVHLVTAMVILPQNIKLQLKMKIMVKIFGY